VARKDQGTDYLVTLYDNHDGYTKNNTLVTNNKVLLYDKSREALGLNAVEIGFFLLHKNALTFLPEGNPSFEKTVIPALIDQKLLTAYITGHPYVSVSTPARLAEAEQFLSHKNVVFLDRDGVINDRAAVQQYISTPDQFTFLPKSIEALKLLADHQYHIIIITNQPGINRGKLSLQNLESIHNTMKNKLKQRGIDHISIYFCPHDWETEECKCRKPQPGMLWQAAREHHLILPRHTFIGDDERDIEAGQAAGCQTILINKSNAPTHADHVFPDLFEAVQFLLTQKKNVVSA